MKKLITLLCCISSILMFTGCSNSSEDYKNGDGSKYFDLMVIETDVNKVIICDKNTKVMYLVTSNGVTPIYNADGTLKLYVEE